MRTHSPSNEHGLPYLPVMSRNIGMAGTKGSSSPFAVHIQGHSPAVDCMLLDLAGVVADVRDQGQEGFRQEEGKGFPDQVGQDLAVGQGAIDSAGHGLIKVLTFRGVDRGADQFPFRQVHPVLGCSPTQDLEIICADLVAQSS